MEPKDRIVLALDVATASRAVSLVQDLGREVGLCKIGEAMINRGEHPPVARACLSVHGGYFHDSKIAGTPDTTRECVKAAVDLGARYISVHASAGPRSLEAAVAARQSARILVVTVLTSINGPVAQRLYGTENVRLMVEIFAKMAQECGADGVICSAQEAQMFKQFSRLVGLEKFAPGIRPEGFPEDDHARPATPTEAILAGVHVLVVGRPLLAPPGRFENSRAALNYMLEEVTKAEAALRRQVELDAPF